ncbi:MAG: sulfite exporter TauE/SafE family protein [Ignavibacteriae bacterium]|nr:sulfite exporter TauE/SafE family protein [Ignavibacteria bacterium]MBI3364037.1 sulfite exporter TauE/SafE family protein [Ignavibacteriota bacterium]
MGWKEIVVRPVAGDEIRQSTVSQEDITNELRSYPQDRLANPLSVSEAVVNYIPGTATETASSLSQSIVEKTKDGFAELISAKELSTSVMLASLLLAMMLGAGHALTPGHGKTIVAAYLVGQRGTAKHAAFLGLAVTITHTLGVFAMGFIALFASHYILPEKLFPWLGLMSGLIVAGIGLSLVRKRFLLARGITHTHDGHTHSHDHVHSHDGHAHSHLPPGADGTPVTWKNLLALGVSGGLLPCPSAIVVLLSAIALGRIGFGLLLIVAFSIGLAGVLTGIGLLMVYARKFFERFNTSGPLVRWLPVVSAGVISIAGVIITLQAFGQLGVDVFGTLASGRLLQSSVFSISMINAGALSILGFGFILGLKHALDSDHLIAVSTIVSERKGFWSSSIVGALWGLGHTASLLIVGLAVIAFNVQIPEKIALAMEFGIALMLIILGANVLWKIRRGASFHMHVHEHDHRAHAHPHLHEHSGGHQHGTVHHHKTKVGKKPFFVGMVHGMAGSAALMLVVLATISSRVLALVYIAVFGIGSVGGMFLMSALIGLPFSFTAKHDRVNTIVRVTAGVLSLCFGLFYAYQIGIIDRLFL